MITESKISKVSWTPSGSTTKPAITAGIDSADLYERLGLRSSTGSYHLRQLREAGVTRSNAVGTSRIVTLRREDLESRLPGLVDVVLRDAAA